MLMKSFKKEVIKVKTHVKIEPNDVLPFFYGEEEPYEIIEVDTFEDFTGGFFPRIRTFIPTLIAQDLVPVQPMEQPNMEIQYIDYRYGTYDLVAEPGFAGAWTVTTTQEVEEKPARHFRPPVTRYDENRFRQRHFNNMQRNRLNRR